MDRSLLAARIQEILKGRPTAPGAGPVQATVADEDAAFAARCAEDEASASVTDVLGGTELDGPGGRCLVVEREYSPSRAHGRHSVERYSAAAQAALHALPWFLGTGAGPALPIEADGRAPRLLFFDLETTGLSGGAGTYAFLVGCGFFEGGAFRTRQFFLRGYGEERALLDAVRMFVDEPRATDGARASALEPPASALPAASCRPPAAAGPSPAAVQPCLVTYNGKAFDLPLIETRYLFHRRASPFAALPHVDMLFAARRLWRRRPVRGAAALSTIDRAAILSPGDLRASCALTSLEQDILGLQRDDDVPGWEIPSRFFAYTRTGDARGLVAVMEHNRLDLLSLAAITAIVLRMAVEQERVTRDRHECLALARLLEYLGQPADAERCYERAAAADGLIEGEVDRLARAEALHWLALHRRRGRRFAAAAEAWRGLLQVPGLDADLRREACEALAIHHEHRAKDLAAARSFALRALDVARGGRHAPDVEHRLSRLSRKIGGAARCPGDDGPGKPFLIDVDDF